MKALVITPQNQFGYRLAKSLKRKGVEVEVVDRESEIKPCDLVFIKGAHHTDTVEAYLMQGIPVFIFDWGYIKRVNSPGTHQTGYWQVSYAKLNGIPDFECPSDRFERLGVEITKKGFTRNGYVLLIGQMPGDAAVHGTDHKQWLIDQHEHYTQRGFDVRYREHPRGGVSLPYPKASPDLIEAIKGAQFVVTFTSNTGHDALLMGVPVVCDKRAAYYPLSGRLPSLRKRQAYFNRLAYGQWLCSETDACIDFVLNEWAGICSQ